MSPKRSVSFIVSISLFTIAVLTFPASGQVILPEKTTVQPAEAPSQVVSEDWATLSRAEALCEDERYDEAVLEVRSIWTRCDSGECADPELAIRADQVYARSLYEVNASRELAYVCQRAIARLITTAPADANNSEKIANLRLWFAEADLAEGNLFVARLNAVKARSIGTDLENTELIARARLLEGRIALEMKDTITARVIFGDCVVRYSPNMDAEYETEANQYLGETEILLGNPETALMRAIEIYETNRAKQSQQSDFFWTVATKAEAESATGIALQAYSLQHQGFGEYGCWTPYMSGEWHGLQNRLGKRLIPRLEEETGAAAGIARTAVTMALAQAYLEEDDFISARRLLEDVRGMQTTPRMAERLSALQDWARGNVPEDRSDAQLLAMTESDSDSRLRFLGAVRGREGAGYGDWLDQHREKLAPATYLVEKGLWLYRDAWLEPEGDEPAFFKDIAGRQWPNRSHPNSEAAGVLEQALKVATDLDDRADVYCGLVTVYARLGKDWLPTLNQFLSESVRAKRRADGLNNIGYAIDGNNASCASPADRRPDVAESIYKLCIERNEDDEAVWSAWFNLGSMQDALGRREEAIESLLNISELNPLECDCYASAAGSGSYRIATIYREIGEVELAEKYYRRLAENVDVYESGLTGDACYWLCKLLVHQKRYKEVLEFAEILPDMSKYPGHLRNFVNELIDKSARELGQESPVQ